MRTDDGDLRRLRDAHPGLFDGTDPDAGLLRLVRDLDTWPALLGDPPAHLVGTEAGSPESPAPAASGGGSKPRRGRLRLPTSRPPARRGGARGPASPTDDRARAVARQAATLSSLLVIALLGAAILLDRWRGEGAPGGTTHPGVRVFDRGRTVVADPRLDFYGPVTATAQRIVEGCVEEMGAARGRVVGPECEAPTLTPTASR